MAERNFKSISIHTEDYVQLKRYRDYLEEKWNEQLKGTGKRVQVSLAEAVKNAVTKDAQRQSFQIKLAGDDDRKASKTNA